MELEAADIVGSRIDFILFVRHQIVFVRVKRSHSRISTAGELNNLFGCDITGFRMIPLTAVVSRELWILLPWGTWQYFLIGDDSITEIIRNTGKVSGEVEVVPVFCTNSTISSSTSIGSSGKGSYSWGSYSGRVPGSDYKISIQSISQPTIKDVSNNYFTVTV